MEEAILLCSMAFIVVNFVRGVIYGKTSPLMQVLNVLAVGCLIYFGDLL